MVKQGDIIKLNLDPQSGHEQAGYRPAVVVSNDFFNMRTNLTIICPVTSTSKSFPLRIPLDERTATTGVVLCDHIKAVDIQSRGYKIVERMPDDLLDRVLEAVFAEIRRI